jgi:hypothetical protein
MKYKVLSFLSLLLFLAACKKEPTLPITDEPAIALLSINKTSIQEFSDSLVFTISYRDGDGDLGISNADSTVIEVVDNRDPANLVFGYHLSPRAPNGAILTVQGELSVVLKNVIILNSTATSETTTFSIRIKDRAQHWSNVVETETVTISK